MNFGVEINDILGIFNGALETDFATAALSGSEVILTEINFASEEALSYLDPSVVDMLENGLYPHAITVTNGSFELLTEASEIDLRLYNPYGIDCWDGLYDTDQTKLLSPPPCDIDFSRLTRFTDYTISGRTVTLGGSYSDQELVVSYKVTDLPLPSVARYVRNKAACLLSHVLYTAGNDTWALTDRLCEEADKWEQRYQTKKLVPPELRNLKWINGSPFNFGIFSIRSRRV